MSIKKGDEIAITVEKGWAEAVSPCRVLRYLSGNETPASRLFIASLVSCEAEGIWVEELKDSEGKAEGDPDRILVPWRFLLAVQTSPLLLAQRRQMGFGDIQKSPT